MSFKGLEMSLSSYVVAGVVVSATALVGYLASKTKAPAARARSLGAKLPPGPKQSFLFGNIANFPQEKWYLHFLEWQKQFGDLVFINLNFAGATILVVNSLDIANELAGRRTRIYSSRPRTTMLSDLMYVGWTLLGIPVGPAFHEQTKIMQKTFGPTVVYQFDGMVQGQVAAFINTLDPASAVDPFDILIPYLGAVIVKAAYGDQFYEKHGDALVKLSLENMELVVSVMTKFWAVDVFPFLRYVPTWFPGAEFRRIGARGTDMGKRIRFEPFEFVQKRMAEGTADDSLVSRFLRDPTVSNDNVRDIAVTSVSAGVDNTATMITHFLYAMALHPEWQRRLHEELDSAIGNGRAPSFDEIKALPYFNVAWKESLRWTPPAPVMNHATSEEDVWNGYYVPKGCIIQFNMGFMLRDPRIWGDESALFKPERFLGPNAKDLPDPTWIPFGFGRRMCSGRFMANRTAMQFASAILSAFDVVLVEGENGEKLTSSTTVFHEETIRRVANFRCHFRPRY